MATAEEIEKKVKERKNLVAAVHNDIIALAKKYHKLCDTDLELYQMLNNPDCLFNDSPLSPFKTAQWMKEFMIKLDMDFIGLLWDGKVAAKTFIERGEEASGWSLRFTEPIIKEKKGIEAILEGAS